MSSSFLKPGEQTVLIYDRAQTRRTEMILPFTVVEDRTDRTMKIEQIDHLIRCRGYTDEDTDSYGWHIPSP